MMENANFKHKRFNYENIRQGRCCFLNCILTIIHSWIFCVILREKTMGNFFLSRLAVLRHHISRRPRAYILIILLLSVSYHINLQRNLTLNHLIRHIYFKNNMRITKTFVCIYTCISESLR